MLRLTDVQNRIKESEQGVFQKVCNQLMVEKGYLPYKLTGSVSGSNKTRKGTPDSVFIDGDNYVYVEITTEQGKLSKKIKSDITKCLDKIETNPLLKGKVSKIVFMHNQDNIEESITEEIKELCGEITFEIYGLDTISLWLQINYPEIAIQEYGIKDDAQMVENITSESAEKIANAFLKKNDEKSTNEMIDKIKTEITKLYEDAILISNSSDALVFISNTDKVKLNNIFISLSVFDFYFKDKNDEDSLIYYHNLLVIISKSDLNRGMEYYNKIPDFAKNSAKIQHFYSMILLDLGKYDEARIILEDLYYIKKYDDSFSNLVKVYFLLNNFSKVVEMLAGVKSDKYDNYGFLASIYILSKNRIKKYEYSEILKLNNNKFKNMPLFYFCTSDLLYQSDKRKKKYIEQFKKGINYLQEDDVIAIESMCNLAYKLKTEDIAISYLESINLSPILQNRLLNLLSKKIEWTENEIRLVENILPSMNENIDSNYLNAKLLENKGRELSAIKEYEKSFLETKNGNSAFRYIQLSIKNRSKISKKIIEDIKKIDNLDFLMLTVEALNYMGDYDNAIEYSYKAIYLSNGSSKFSSTFKQFWITMTFHNKKSDCIEHVIKDCVVILKSNDNKKIYLLEDDEYFKEGTKVLNAQIIRSGSDTALNLLHLKNNDEVLINNNTFKIEKIMDKYTYFANSAFKYIKDDKSTKLYTSIENNKETFLDELRKDMIITNNEINKRLDIYQENKNIPLSALLSTEKNFDEYAKLINTLLCDSDRILYAGEAVEVELNNGFVIDISSLIILSILDMLDVFEERELCKIYITKSFKNKFAFFYEGLLRKSEDKESSLYIVEDRLALNESLIFDQIKFWKKLNSYIDKFSVVDIESEKDELYNSKTSQFFDKVQFDLMQLAKEKNIPFICDDLLIRKICNNYNISHSNALYLIKISSSSFEKYCLSLLKLSKMNYLYTLYTNDLAEMLVYVYENYSDDNKTKFLNILNSVLENKVCLEFYIPILLDKCKNLKSVQYIKIFDQTYENLLVTFFIDSVYEIVNRQCFKYGIKIDDLYK